MKKKSVLKYALKLILGLSAVTACAVLALYFFQSQNTSAVADVSSAETVPVNSIPSESEPDASAPYTPTLEELLPLKEPAPRDYSIRLMALGDDLIHMGVLYTGLQSDGSFDFSFLFRDITEFLDRADVKIINQETIFGGNQLGFSGFPRFNSPSEVGDSIAAAGFNVVLQATNHSADQGIEGMENCVSFWKKYPEILMVGIHSKENSESENPDQEAPEPVPSIQKDPVQELPTQEAPTAEREIPLLTIEDVTFAVLNYTYGPNMGTLPSYLQGRLDELCAYDPKSGVIDFTTLNPQVIEDIQAAKELADLVVVCPHWGTEYSTTPSRYQKKFALEMAEAGADLIIGTHPHVIQPVEWIEAENGNRALCFYSLGNYVSTQKNPQSMLEAMAWVTIDVKGDEISLSRENSGAIPLVCHYSSNPVRIRKIRLLEDYTAEQADSHGIRDYGEVPLVLDDLLQWRDNILGEYVLSAGDVLSTPPREEDNQNH